MGRRNKGARSISWSSIWHIIVFSFLYLTSPEEIFFEIAQDYARDEDETDGKTKLQSINQQPY